MLILTDGEPSDIDVNDSEMLIKDTHKAVQECQQKGMYPYCISLDNKADEYISEFLGLIIQSLTELNHYRRNYHNCFYLWQNNEFTQILERQKSC